jgi:hypothetical protein
MDSAHWPNATESWATLFVVNTSVSLALGVGLDLDHLASFFLPFAPLPP